jgi:hypothetical protein
MNLFTDGLITIPSSISELSRYCALLSQLASDSYNIRPVEIRTRRDKKIYKKGLKEESSDSF